MELIQSKENTLIKRIRKLKEKRYRSESNQFLIEGFRFLEEAVKSRFDISYIFINEKELHRWNDFHHERDIKNSTRIFMLKDMVFKTLSATENSQGIIAVVNNVSSKLQDRDGFYVLVDKIQDPGNMGTIIRTAHAAGALGVLYTRGTVDIYNEKTLRSTMGSIFHIPVMEDASLQITKGLKKNGFSVIISSLDTDNNFYDIDLKKNSIICIGNEGNGITNDVLELADTRIKIPMPGGAESLNAAVAASIMIFEVVRQKNK